jgi:hypothetical protein
VGIIEIVMIIVLIVTFKLSVYVYDVHVTDNIKMKIAFELI